MSKLNNKRNVFFGLHLYRIPKCVPFINSLNSAARLLKKHNYSPGYACVWHNPYIQMARNKLVEQFLNSDCDIFMFVADDVEFSPEDLLRVVETPGKVVAGAYRVKAEKEHYPVYINRGPNGIPLTRFDGCISAQRVQTGFLRIHRSVFEEIILNYPELAYYGTKDGQRVGGSHDFFPQGVYKHKWIGEDYAFCDLWTGIGGKIWIVPDINIIHYEGEESYPGNYHEYLKALPGGINYKEK